MGVIYRKVPLTVKATFTPDGSILPENLIYNDSTFSVDKILSKTTQAPKMVMAIAPVEYTVMIKGYKKKIYYESQTNSWFSVKEVYT